MSLQLPPAFRVEAEHRPDAYVITVEGELDLAGRPDLEAALAAAELTQANRILLDLEGLTFIDAAAIHALLQAARRSARNGSRLSMTRGTGGVARLFQLLALDQTLPFTGLVSLPALGAEGNARRP